MNFTSSPFERMMKEKPRPKAPAENRPPRGSFAMYMPVGQVLIERM